jgi:hypothetical protein
VPANTTLGASSTIAAHYLYDNFPLFNGVTETTNPWARYRYDSLQLSAQKRFSGGQSAAGGILTTFSYTFSKNFQTANFLNNYDIAQGLVHELVPYDKPQNFAFTRVWDVPVGRGRYFLSAPNRVADHILGGWTINWIYRFTSGNPVNGIDAIDYCPSLLIPNQTHDQWFNHEKLRVQSTPRLHSSYRAGPLCLAAPDGQRYRQPGRLEEPPVDRALAPQPAGGSLQPVEPSAMWGAGHHLYGCAVRHASGRAAELPAPDSSGRADLVLTGSAASARARYAPRRSCRASAAERGRRWP